MSLQIGSFAGLGSLLPLARLFLMACQFSRACIFPVVADGLCSHHLATVQLAIQIGRDYELLDHGGCYHWQGKRVRQLRKFERLLAAYNGERLTVKPASERTSPSEVTSATNLLNLQQFQP